METIESVYCKAPWNGIHIRMDGNVYPCCLSDYPIGNILQSSWKEVVSGDRMKALRKGFISQDPEILKTCGKCYLCTEGSIRGRYNSVQDGKLDVDVRISNVCNLACRMCGPWASTRWEKESGVSGNAMSKEDRLRLVAFVKEQASQIENLSLVGGEPTLIPEYVDLLRYLVETGDSDNIRIIFNTNVQQFPKEYYELVSKFKRVDMCLSIDAVGSLGDWIRTGSKWEKTQNVVDKIVKLREQNNIFPCIVPVISLLNIFQIDEVYGYGKEKGIPVSGDNILFDPKLLCLGYLSYNSKQVIGKYLDNCKNLPPFLVDKIKQYLIDTEHIEGFEQQAYEYILSLGSGYFELAKEQEQLLRPNLSFII